MKILITGGAGYIGSVLVPKLLAKGHEVVVIDNFRYGQTPLLDVIGNPKLSVIRGDARDRKLLERTLDGVDFILPLACLTGAPISDQFPDEAITTTRDGIKHILELRKPNQKIIYPTTNSGYGIGEQGIECTEKTPLRPISLYGRLKVEAEKAILESGDAITFRLATVFGASPRMRIDLLVNDFVYRAVNDRAIVLFEAHFKRNYLHIQDVAKVFLHGIEHFDAMKNEPYNVGLSNANLSKWELCEKIKVELPQFYFAEAAVGKDPDQRNYIVSNSKIEKTGFKPDIGLEDGIRELIKTYEIIQKYGHSNI